MSEISTFSILVGFFGLNGADIILACECPLACVDILSFNLGRRSTIDPTGINIISSRRSQSNGDPLPRAAVLIHGSGGGTPQSDGFWDRFGMNNINISSAAAPTGDAPVARREMRGRTDKERIATFIWGPYLGLIATRKAQKYQLMSVLYQNVKRADKMQKHVGSELHCRSITFTGVSIPLSPRLCLFCSAHSESSL